MTSLSSLKESVEWGIEAARDVERELPSEETQMPWSVVVLGWPFVALAGVVFLIAFLSSRRWLGFAGSALAAPLCFLVGLYSIPMGHYGGPIALATNFISAWLLYRGRREIAFAFLVPHDAGGADGIAGTSANAFRGRRGEPAFYARRECETLRRASRCRARGTSAWWMDAILARGSA